jgi:hypothetical protein
MLLSAFKVARTVEPYGGAYLEEKEKGVAVFPQLLFSVRMHQSPQRSGLLLEFGVDDFLILTSARTPVWRT